MSDAVADNKTKREVGEHVVFHGSLQPTETKDLGEGVIEAVITTGATDHHNENILMEGVDTSAYHGTVLYGHDYEGLPIGKTISLTKMKSKIKAKFQLAVDIFPFANLVYEMIKGGYLTDVSIGGLVRKWSDDWMTIEEMVMKEFSVVPIGANPEAMISAVKSLGVKPEKIKEEYEHFARQVLVDKLEDMPHDEVNDAIRVMKNLVARLEESAKTEPSEDAQEGKRIKHVVLRDARAVVTQSMKVTKLVKIKEGLNHGQGQERK